MYLTFSESTPDADSSLAYGHTLPEFTECFGNVEKNATKYLEYLLRKSLVSRYKLIVFLMSLVTGHTAYY